MSKNLGRILSTPRNSGRQCRRMPTGWRSQVRSMSDVQQASTSASPSSQPPRHPVSQSALRSTPTQDSSGELEQHLNSLFPPLKFPPELAARILTHASHPDAVQRHNARLSFIGRRVLQSYLLLFLHGSPALQPVHDYEYLAERALNTYVLGEHVAPVWSLGKVIKWIPVHSGPLAFPVVQEQGAANILARLGPEASRSVGLYKVQGTAVEALVGGVFHQFGGSVAHRLFHTRLLPNILLPGKPEGLHDAFHQHAMEICGRMGGPTGSLLAPAASE